MCVQIANVTRPLMSVPQICDNGHTVLFDTYRGTVKDSRGAVVVVFKRVGGLYIGKFILKAPFRRHA